MVIYIHSQLMAISLLIIVAVVMRWHIQTLRGCCKFLKNKVC